MSVSKKVLDLGSGEGIFVEVCKDNKIDAYGLDAYLNGIDFEKDKIPFLDEQFDFIILTSLIEHIGNPQLLLNEIHRVLKKGGLIIITTPNFKYSYSSFYDDPTHIKPYTKKSIEKILHLNNFEVVRTLPFLVKKSTFFWTIPFSFFIAQLLPFKNHMFKKNFLIPAFLKGKSTAMTTVAKK